MSTLIVRKLTKNSGVIMSLSLLLRWRGKSTASAMEKTDSNRGSSDGSVSSRVTGIRANKDLPRLLNKAQVLIKVKFDVTNSSALLKDAVLAEFPYRQDANHLDQFAPDWGVNKVLSKQLAEKYGMQFDEYSKMIIDRKSGLTAAVFHNMQNTEVRLVFGGTTSGQTAGGFLTRSLNNAAMSGKHWGANIGNALVGKIPQSYQQAASMTATFMESVRLDSLMEKYHVSVSGHSKGGGEAAYAAAMNFTQGEEPVRAICFCSAELGKGLQQALLNKHKSSEVVKQASDKISHYLIKGDVVPHVSKIFTSLTSVGTSVTLHTRVPHRGWSKFFNVDGPMRHDRFFKHIQQGLSHTAKITKKSDHVE